MQSAGERLSETIRSVGWPPNLPPLIKDIRALSDSMEPARHRGYLLLDEFKRLAKRKSRQGLHLIDLNKAETVEAVTKIAFSRNLSDERTRIGLLTSLRGVDIPRASAILCWTHPDLWPVIDRRAWTTLNHLGLVRQTATLKRADTKQSMRAFSRKEWTEYLTILTAASDALSWSKMDVDQWLYACDLAENVHHLLPKDA